MNISNAAVVIASCGRATEVGQLLEHLEMQTLKPQQVILSVVSDDDVPALSEQHIDFELIMGTKGSCVQRNVAIDSLRDDIDIVVFLDDDYVPSRYAIEGICKTFCKHPGVVGIEGKVLADGVTTGGIGYEDSLKIVKQYDDDHPLDHRCVLFKTGLAGLYGCNMAFRVNSIGKSRFDLSLPLYGWQEDVDFSYRVGRSGLLAGAEAFSGVHRGVVASRSPGIKLGYSQVANPFYLCSKGTMQRKTAFLLVVRNLLANHIKALKPEAWVDRKGRVRGNWIAMLDALKGRLSPKNILTL